MAVSPEVAAAVLDAKRYSSRKAAIKQSQDISPQRNMPLASFGHQEETTDMFVQSPSGHHDQERRFALEQHLHQSQMEEGQEKGGTKRMFDKDAGNPELGRTMQRAESMSEGQKKQKI